MFLFFTSGECSAGSRCYRVCSGDGSCFDANEREAPRDNLRQSGTCPGSGWEHDFPSMERDLVLDLCDKVCADCSVLSRNVCCPWLVVHSHCFAPLKNILYIFRTNPFVDCNLIAKLSDLLNFKIKKL